MAATTTQPARQRCEQCGRAGTRGFRTIHVEPWVRDGVTLVTEHDYTECASRAACMKRWPKTARDED